MWYKLNWLVHKSKHLGKRFNKRTLIISEEKLLTVSEKKCAVCNGQGKIVLLDTQCSFCNGTGEYTKSAESYIKSHICQCIFLDRVTCPLCGKKCHHDTPNKPKILLGPV